MPTGRRMVVVHGTADTWTDQAASRRRQTTLAQARGLDARWIGMAGTGHTMLRHPGRWHRIAVDFVRDRRAAVRPSNVS